MKRILVVDDNPENRCLLEVLLNVHGYAPVFAGNGEVALDMARQQPPDLVIADILMPVMDGYRLCRYWKADAILKQIPFIFYTAACTESDEHELDIGLGGERLIVNVQAPEKFIGIVEEVLQHQGTAASEQIFSAIPQEKLLQRLNMALARKLETKLMDVERLRRELSIAIADRMRFEEKLAWYEDRFFDILDAVPMAMIFTFKNGEMLYINKQFFHQFGYCREELPDLSTWLGAAYPDVSLRSFMLRLWQNAPQMDGQTGGQFEPVEVCIRCKDGTNKNVSVLEVIIHDIHMTAYHDLTAYRTLFSQLIQAQKMAVVGQFAGGIAHDFGNILTAIGGYGMLLTTSLHAEDASRKYVEKILSVSARGEKLIRNLFSFGRKQETKENPVELNHIINEAEDILVGMKRDDIELKKELCDGSTTIIADTNQIEQVLMNLVKNASDSIEGPGTITIGTQKGIPGDQPTGLGSACGVCPHVLLTVTDTGHGMDEETCKNIFEPFFTRKEKGKGTGLGLSVVRGIIERHKGRVAVYSTPGIGSTFSVYLPAQMFTEPPDALEDR